MNPFKREPLAICGVCDFSHALKFLELEFVLARLQIGHQHAVGTLPVAQAKFESKVVADEDKSAKRFIIAN